MVPRNRYVYDSQTIIIQKSLELFTLYIEFLERFARYGAVKYGLVRGRRAQLPLRTPVSQCSRLKYDKKNESS